MAFGLASALAFAYIPLVKLAGQPLIAYRLPPRFIIYLLAKRLGVKVKFTKFRKMFDGMDALNEAVAQGKLVGLQTSVFWLPYFPDEMRFHFNAHNLLVYGRDNNEFLISDPVFEEPVTISEKDLTKARFAKGPLAPKGLMYEIEEVPASIDYARLIPLAINRNSKIMLKSPLPIIGVRGIQHLAKKISRLGGRRNSEEQRLLLGHIVRMQEEIGTGGAGFRFMYASFLSESAELLNDDDLRGLSVDMTAVGDQWREFAVATVKAFKSRDGIDLAYLSEQLRLCAVQEKQIWRQLHHWSKTHTSKTCTSTSRR